jgi:hypothetical protein
MKWEFNKYVGIWKNSNWNFGREKMYKSNKNTAEIPSSRSDQNKERMRAWHKGRCKRKIKSG